MPNIWKQFEQLIDTDSVYVATVTSVGASSIKVELLSGDPLLVRPGGISIAVGEMVYIKGGEIIQKAPAPLPRHDLILY